MPWSSSSTDNATSSPPPTSIRSNAKIQVTPDIQEWDYGEYEGKTSAQIRHEREEKGIEGGKWDIWKDGCPGGEYVPCTSTYPIHGLWLLRIRMLVLMSV